MLSSDIPTEKLSVAFTQNLLRSTTRIGKACVYVTAVCLLCTPAVLAQENPRAALSFCVPIEVYGQQGDPQYEKAIAAVEQLNRTRGGITLVERETGSNARNQDRLNSILKHFHLASDATPIIYGCNQAIHSTTPDKTWQLQVQELLRVEVFVRTGCTRCASAKSWLPTFIKAYPGFELVFHDVSSDQAQAAHVSRLISQHRVAGASVPITSICNQLVVGFETVESFEARILKALHVWTHVCPQANDGLKSKPAFGPVNPQSSSPRPRLYIESIANRHSLPITLAIEYPLRVETRAMLVLAQIGAKSITTTSELPLPATGGEEQTASNADLPIPGFADEKIPEEADDSIQLPMFGSLKASKLGLPLFTIAVGLVDGFNPCAMWVLLFLLSILVNLHDRVRILAIAGTFVLISGLSYFAFMTAWINVFQWVGFLRPVQIGLGTIAIVIGGIHIKDFFAFKQGISLSIPDSAKPGIYARVRRIVTAEHLFGAVAGAVVLAVLVNFVELLCTAGLPALYTAILAQQPISTAMRYAYLGLYIAAYMLDDVLMVSIVIVTLSKKKLQESQGRWLKLFSGSAILLIGLIMIFRPEWLS